jgi:hypothetical protein
MRGKRQVERHHWATPEIVDQVNRIRREAKIRSNIGSADHAEIERNTQRYGAKGANLIAARKVLAGMNKSMLFEKVHIPAFTLLDTDCYERWKSGEDITEVLESTHRWIGGRATYIRSSAVHSEDREDITGAGIYDSVPLKKGASIEELRTAVEQVYRSVDAPKGMEYRAHNGVSVPEQMGIVVQQRVLDRGRHGQKAYINTVRPYAPGLLEIVMEERAIRCICSKQAIEEQLWRNRHDLEHIAYYQIDARRYADSINAWTSKAHIGQLLEMHFGYPVQIECIGSNVALNLLQVRHLPKNLLRTADVHFPEGKEPLHESDAIGVGDMVLDVLPPERENRERKGVVIFYRSYGMSEQYIEQYLPKEGAVIILCPSQENFGHIETLCVERGLLCIFNSRSRMHTSDKGPPSPVLEAMFKKVDHRFVQITRFEDFAGHRRLNIVANGLRAKIYAAEV